MLRVAAAARSMHRMDDLKDRGRATLPAASVALLRRVVRAARARAAAAPLKRLRRHPDATVRRIGLVLAQPHTDPEIETQRAAMLGDGSPLDDGTLPGSLRHDAGLSIGQACRASMPPRKAAVLSALAGAFQPACAVELGTNVGVSAAYIARAVRGTLTTFEVSPYRLRAARRLHQRLGLSNIRYVQGRFGDTLDEALRGMPTVDFAFIDGHHRFRPTLDYTDAVVARAAEGAVFVYDDIRWSDGMREAWEALRQDPRFGIALDLDCIGVCVLGRQPQAGRLVAGPVRIA